MNVKSSATNYSDNAIYIIVVCLLLSKSYKHVLYAFICCLLTSELGNPDCEINKVWFIGKNIFPSAITMYALTFIIVLTISCTYGQDRKLSSKLNPGCMFCGPYENLMYVRADGSHDTVHQLWDFTRSTPTIIFIITSLNTTVNMTWDNATPRKIWTSAQPKYSFAIAIDKLYEYDDLLDNGHIDDRSPSRWFSLGNASWSIYDVLQTEQEVRLMMKSSYKNDETLGTILLKLDLLPFQDYAVELPHLIHTANSTLVDVTLVNLTTSRDYNASRFALHFLLVSTDSRTDSMNFTMRKSLDDEHTPGVFEIIEIRTPESSRGLDGGFIQFRPVAYTQPERGVTSSTIAHVSNFNRTRIPRGSILRTFYRSFDEANLLVQDMFVSFGEAGDGFYKQHNFTAWSFTVGYGAPPKENFSFFVIMIISIGLGVPVLLALSGIVYVMVRRCRHRNTPTRFLDDE